MSGEGTALAVRQAWADLRVQVVNRLRRMNAHHAQHAWDQRIRDPLAPYGFAFFMYEPVGGRFALRTATRLFLHGDAPHPLPRLVYELTQHAVRAQQDRADPLVRLTDRREPLTGQARFLGVGVSSLDSRWQPWATTLRAATGILDIPGRCLAVLNDGTTMVIDRGGREHYEQFRIRSTAELDVGQRFLDWRWSPDVAGLLDGEPPLVDADRHGVSDAVNLLTNLARVLGVGRP